ncbi:MAG TPA: hypothetical protein VFV95_03205 [Vicinamibacterales bacterium]|nr:hypothetical protein [Vicinamibacterales bacterium]
MEPQSLPFSIPKLYEGFATAHGIARMTPAGLTLEFEVKDGIVGMIKSGVREVQIAIDDLHQLELRKGWLRTRLFIRTRRMTAVNRIPGNRAGMIELRVARQDRQIAESLVSLVMLRLSERELEKLGRHPAFGA